MAGAEHLNLDTADFLARYWQREPLFIKNAINDFQLPLEADSLAGLALEEHVESRIIRGQDSSWSVQHGPFLEQDFQAEPPWTLLVQAVDHHVDNVAQLRQLFNFIPQWRIDDVMVSYATRGGSVGPHFDNYDVFLLQGEGERLWRLGQRCNEASALLPQPELRILEDFQIEEEFLLRAGDVLYVPPGVAHWGIAQTACTTFSIGFRAPRHREMVARWTDELIDALDAGRFYSDPGLSGAQRPGEISRRDQEQAETQLKQAIAESVPGHWFGELVTEPRYAVANQHDDLASASALLGNGATSVELSAAAKVAWQEERDHITVFANGDSHQFGASVLANLLLLCKTWQLQGDDLGRGLDDPDTAELLQWLLQCGCIYVE